MRSIALLLIIAAIIYCCESKTYLEENFDEENWEKDWIYSKHPGKEFGKFVRTAGKLPYKEEDKGIQTSQDARFYAISRKFKPFSNKDEPLVIQFSVKHEQNIDCGGGYVKVFDCSLDQTDMHGESPYEIMFGPDICGPGTKKVHVIFNYKGKNVLINKDIRCKDDVFTHFYTLVVKPDNTYEVLIDNEKVESGNLEEDWDFLEPKKIKDPNAKKPEDWDERPTIPDPDDKKPDDWEKSEHIPDPDATKPEDWDDEMDGDWEPPMIDNPEYKGEWQPKQIDNPNYKGIWKHPEIDNPAYTPDSELYLRKELCIVGLDLWQVKSGTIFDNILVTNDPEYAKEKAQVVSTIQEAEKEIKKAQEEEESKKMEEESKKDDSKNDDDEEDEDEDKGIPDIEDDTTTEESHDEL